MQREFDGTKIIIDSEKVTVKEGEITLTLWKAYLTDGWVGDARWNVTHMRKVTKWEADRIVYCFGLAQTWMAQSA